MIIMTTIAHYVISSLSTPFAFDHTAVTDLRTNCFRIKINKYTAHFYLRNADR